MLLGHPKLAASGHHQPEGSERFRSIIYRASGCSVLVVCAYFLPGISLDSPPNQERCSSIRCLIDSLKIPWRIVAGWNRSHEEVGSSYSARYLGGAVVAPNVLMICSSTADGGGRVLDFGLVSTDIASKVQCEANFKVPFKLHFVGVDFTIDLGYAADTGQQLVTPADLKFCQGPRPPEHSWARLFHSALGDQ